MNVSTNMKDRCNSCGKKADGFVNKEPLCQKCLDERNLFKDYNC